MIGELYEEAKDMSSDDSDNPIVGVLHQLPYFCCPNIILDRQIQDDIQRYIYCEDTGTQPYPGDYGDVPAKWMTIHFILKGSISASQNEYRKEYQRKMKIKNNKSPKI